MAKAYLYDLTDTWNAGGTTFTGIGLNVTDAASAAGSLLIDLQVGGASKAKVSKTGNLTVAGYFSIADGVTAPSAATGEARIYVDSADGDLKVIFADGTIKTIVTDS